MTVQLSADVETPCYGKGRLFDSIELADHIVAKSLCDQCPAFAACAKLLESERVNRLPGAGPVGTWAGRLVGKRGGQRK